MKIIVDREIYAVTNQAQDGDDTVLSVGDAESIRVPTDWLTSDESTVFHRSHFIHKYPIQTIDVDALDLAESLAFNFGQSEAAGGHTYDPPESYGLPQKAFFRAGYHFIQSGDMLAGMNQHERTAFFRSLNGAFVARVREQQKETANVSD